MGDGSIKHGSTRHGSIGHGSIKDGSKKSSVVSRRSSAKSKKVRLTAEAEGLAQKPASHQPSYRNASVRYPVSLVFSFQQRAKPATTLDSALNPNGFPQNDKDFNGFKC